MKKYIEYASTALLILSICTYAYVEYVEVSKTATHYDTRRASVSDGWETEIVPIGESK